MSTPLVVREDQADDVRALAVRWGLSVERTLALLLAHVLRGKEGEEAEFRR